jgi:hypothetical protein
VVRQRLLAVSQSSMMDVDAAELSETALAMPVQPGAVRDHIDLRDRLEFSMHRACRGSAISLRDLSARVSAGHPIGSSCKYRANQEVIRSTYYLSSKNRERKYEFKLEG